MRNTFTRSIAALGIALASMSAGAEVLAQGVSGVSVDAAGTALPVTYTGTIAAPPG